MIKQGADHNKEIADVLRDACRRAGLNSTGAKFLRHSVNVVYLLKSASVIVRLRKGAREDVERTMAIAKWLTELEAPVIRLVRNINQPVQCGEYTATFWEAAQDREQRWQGADLGLALRELHMFPPAPALAMLDPLQKVRLQLAMVESRNGVDRSWLDEECEKLDIEYRQIVSSMKKGTVHGDAKIGNLLRDQSGRIVFCDLDDVAHGPLAYDLVPTAVDAIRWGKRVRQATLAHAYGLDVTTLDSWPVLRRIRELRMIATLVAKRGHESEAAAEAQRRIEAIRSGDDTARWTRFMTA